MCAKYRKACPFLSNHKIVLISTHARKNVKNNISGLYTASSKELIVGEIFELVYNEQPYSVKIFTKTRPFNKMCFFKVVKNKIHCISVVKF